MTSRERVLTALKGGQPDRVPFVDEMDPGMQAQIMGHSPVDPVQLADKMGFDAISLKMFPPLFVSHKMLSSGINYISETGIRSRSDLEQAVFPELDAAYLEQAEQFISRCHGTGLALGLVSRMGCSGVLNSMGIENFSYALADDLGVIETLLDRYADWACELLLKTRNMGFDFFKFADDIAFKTGPLFSPQVFRELFLPRMRRVASQVPGPWIFHSDGNLMPVFDDLLSLGMNAVNPIEPGAMDIDVVKQRYGKRICIHGNIDLHYTLTRGTPAEVRAEVRHRIAAIGAGGGYIIASANSITDYCRVENVLEMRDAIREYGVYH